MKREKIKVAILITLVSNLAYGQVYWRDFATKNIPVPEVSKLSSLTVAGDNVDLSTGLITPKVSVTNISVRTLSDAVSLTYSKGAGVKVNDISSDVGLGWELEAGGYISRKVNGFADESQIYTDAVVGQWASSPTHFVNGQKSINGWLDFGNWNSKVMDTPFNGTFLFPGQPYQAKSLGGTIQEFVSDVKIDHYKKNFRSLLAQSVYGGNGDLGSGSTVADLAAIAGMGWQLLNVDGEPDEFYFKFGKYSGKFVFDGDRVPTTIPYVPGLKIESPFGTPDNQWIITTPEGVKYYFSNSPEYTEVTYTEALTLPYFDDWMDHTPNTNEAIDASEYTSKWHLTKVEGVNGESISYAYTSAPDLIYDERSSIKEVFKPGQPAAGYTATPPSYFVGSGNPGFQQRELDRNPKYRIRSPKRISSITTSDNNRILFKYEGLDREDIDQSQNGSNHRKSLSAIEKYDYNGKQIEKFTFDQSYFQSTCTTYGCKRLKLNAVKQSISADGSNDIKTSFDYNTTQNLPARNSFTQDFWGYYNNNTVNSLIPTVPDIAYVGADRSPDQTRAQANILTKITYPTKGIIEYGYEINDFRTIPVNGVYLRRPTAGLRIKNITRKVAENDPNPQIVSYSYQLDNGESSGDLPPHLSNTYINDSYGAGKLYDHQTIEVDEDNGMRSRYNMIYSSPKYIKWEDPVRYSKVKVTTPGKGEVEYNFTSSANIVYDDMINREWVEASTIEGFKPDPAYINGSDWYTKSFSVDDNYPTINFTNSANKGLLLSEKVKDVNGNVLSETINTYERNPAGFNMKTVYGIGVSSLDAFTVENTRIQSFRFHINQYYNEFYFLKNKLRTEYFNGQGITTTESFNYSPDGFLSTANTVYPDNVSKEEKHIYPSEKQIQKLVNANIISEAVEHRVTKNNKLIQKVEKKFEDATNLLPTSISTYLLSNANDSYKNVTIDRYDSKGNQLQITSQDNISKVILWGYKATQPIAMIEGATYAQIMQAFGLTPNDNNAYLLLDIVKKSDLDVDNDSENVLVSALNSFRVKPEFKDFRITTYTYDPLIGVKSITGPSGIRENYIYDVVGRLEKVVDDNGKLLKELKYNYKN